MWWRVNVCTAIILALVVPGVRSQSTATVAPQASWMPTAGGAGPAVPAAGPGTAAAGYGPGYGVPTHTSNNQHPFCTRPPVPATPKINIYGVDIRTGFPDGYRLNQTVIVEITAKFPDVWRIQQVFVHVPDNNPIPANVPRGNDYRYSIPKQVGHWAWNLKTGNPDVGGTQPVDCGGIASYGPFGMLSSMGAHAAVHMENSDPNFKGYTSVIAKWVPPSDWQSILYRRTITFEAFVTFEKIPPSNAPAYNPYSYHQQPPPQESRWIKVEATILNRDFVDVHNYLIMTFGPNYQQFFGPPKPVPIAAKEL